MLMDLPHDPRHDLVAVFADVEHVLSMVRELWAAVRNDHFSEGGAMYDGPTDAIHGMADLMQYQPLAVIEAYANVEAHPFNVTAIDREARPLGLDDIER